MTETTPNPSGLKARAEEIRNAGKELLEGHKVEELQEVWRRLPEVPTSLPKGPRALAELIALRLSDMKLDLKQVADKEPVRDWPTTTSTKPSTTSGTTPEDDKETTMPTTHTTHGKNHKAASNAAARKALAKKGPPKAKAAAKKTAAPRKSDGPREGTITALIVKMSHEKKSAEAITNAVVREFPKSTIAKAHKAGKDTEWFIVWHQKHAKDRGWKV